MLTRSLCASIRTRVFPHALARLGPLALLLSSWTLAEAAGLNSDWTPPPLEPEVERQSLVVVTIWETLPVHQKVAAYCETELREAMADLGMRTRFVSLEEATSQSFSGRIVVLRMSGDTVGARKRLPSMPEKALAWTHASGDDITPFGTVDLGALLAFLRLHPTELAMESGVERFGRAIGRVSAHELFHMITRTKEHSDRGLMQPALTTEQLLSERRPEWLPQHREMALCVFPQANAGGMLAAVRGEPADQNPVRQKSDNRKRSRPQR